MQCSQYFTNSWFFFLIVAELLDILKETPWKRHHEELFSVLTTRGENGTDQKCTYMLIEGGGNFGYQPCSLLDNLVLTLY